VLNSNISKNLLLDAGTAKSFLNIDANIEDSIINRELATAQDTRIRNLIGKDMLDELVSQYTSDTLTTANAAVIDYVQRALAYYALANFAYSGAFIATRSGFKRKAGTEAEPLTKAELSANYNHYLGIAEEYAGQLRTFICDNSGDYPLYCGTNRDQPGTSTGVVFYTI